MLEEPYDAGRTLHQNTALSVFYSYNIIEMLGDTDERGFEPS